MDPSPVTLYGASGYRVRIGANYVTPLSGPTYRTHIWYTLYGNPFGRRDVAIGDTGQLAVLR
jgi:hypothetical protein